MTATEVEGARRASYNGAQTLPEASIGESVRVLVTGVVPSVLRGLFSPRRRWMKLLTAVNSDGRAIRVLSGVRSRHGGEGVRLLGGRIVVLWGDAAIREVLDRSGEDFGSDSGAKAKGMCHFQPDALTLSRGTDWQDRRAFNESVLATSERVHPFGERFAAVVVDELARLRVGGRELEWADWERLFDRITLRVIFGDRSRGDQELTDLLEKLMGEANRLVGLSENDEYYDFYAGLERHLREPEPGSLLARFADAPQSHRTRITHQIPHWIFAMRDTLGANSYRALAAIVADPAVLGRARLEISDADLSDPHAIDGMRYLEGALQEAMRLWPTTPLLARETTRATTVVGAQLDAGTQVMMVNVFNHRAPEGVPDADRLVPERWREGAERDYRFNQLSNGTQDCPGGPLVLLLGKAAIAGVLSAYELELREPAGLAGGGSLPTMLDFFAIRFAAEPLAPAR